MERLTERKRNYDRTGISKKSLIVEEGIRKGTPSSYCAAIVTKLADLEDSLEDGKLIELPCKPGDTVYVMNDDCECPGDCYQSQTCKSCEYRNLYIDEEVATLSFIIDNIDNFGKTVFLTEQEAMEALEGIEE